MSFTLIDFLSIFSTYMYSFRYYCNFYINLLSVYHMRFINFLQIPQCIWKLLSSTANALQDRDVAEPTSALSLQPIFKFSSERSRLFESNCKLPSFLSSSSLPPHAVAPLLLFSSSIVCFPLHYQVILRFCQRELA